MTAVQQRPPRVRWRISALATAVAASAALTTGTASAAPRMAASAAPQTALKPALSCGPSGCGNPAATDCWDSSAYVAASAKIYDSSGAYLGYVDNWYSPDCGTSAAEVVSNVGPAYLTVWAATADASTPQTTADGDSAFSAQLYGGNLPVSAYGTIYVNSTINGSAVAVAN